MAEHDKFCDSRTHESWCDCRKIDVIRADAREQIVRDVAIHVAVLESERDAARVEVAALREEVEAVRELLHRQRVLHANLIAPTHPNAPVLIQVDQVLALIEEVSND